MRPVFDQCVKSIRQRDRCTNRDVLREVRNAAQRLHSRQVQQFVKLPVLLGDPKANIGAAGHQLRVGVGCAGGKKCVQT